MNALVTLERQLAPLAPQFAEVLGATMPVERLIRTVMVSAERLPKLLECNRQSLFNAAMSAAVLGLEVDGVTGQAFLIPFKDRAQLVIGYKGFNTLAARAGITITGGVVRDGDEFDFNLGEGWISHKPALGNKGRLVAAWAKASHMSRPPVIVVLSIDELMAVKEKSPGAKRSDSPWNDTAIGFPAMCEKTAKRRLARSLPMNIMQMAARLDEAVDEQGLPARIDKDRGVVIDGEILAPADHPTTAELITRNSPAGEAAAAGPAPSNMGKHDGAGAAPEWRDYVERWDSMLDEAIGAKQIGELWNSDAHKAQRRAIDWPDDVTPDPLDDLTQRVKDKIAALKSQTSTQSHGAKS